MKISIVIPTYNGEKYIEAAIESVLAQIRPADEIIVSDDNSLDRTLDICSRYDGKVKIYKNSEGPSGFVNGWNKAIEYASGEYVSILHQDDLLSPDFLLEIEAGLLKYPKAKHIFVPCNYIDENGDVIKWADYCDDSIRLYSGAEYIKAYQMVDFPYHIHRCPGVVTHRSIFDKCRYRTEAGHIADDDFFYRVGQYTDVVGILKPLAFYRHHSNSETGHLDNIVLNGRLADDYIFQCRHLDENSLLDDMTKEFFYRAAKLYSSKEYYLGVINKNIAFAEKGRRDIRILQGEFGIRPSLKFRLCQLLERVFGLEIMAAILRTFLAYTAHRPEKR